MESSAKLKWGKSWNKYKVQVTVTVLEFTSRKGQKCWVLLEVSCLVQEVLGVEGPGGCPLLLIFQHRVQKGNNHCILLT